jgi:hypothetical protein
MLNYDSLRDIYKDIDSLQSDYLITAEWNMNKYIQIDQYGIYRGAALKTEMIYAASSSLIVDGQNYLIYSDETIKASPEQEYFSQLSSVFQPNRPDPGIILLQKFGNMVFVDDALKLKASRLNPKKPRYYPYSYNRPYDYFNSAKILDYDPQESADPVDDFNIYQKEKYGVSDPRSGGINNANPFVVYNRKFPCNKIRIKVQNHLSVPDKFSIDVLVDGRWETAYTFAESSSADFATGILDIYYDQGDWSTEIKRIDDIAKLNDTNSSEFMIIKGIRMNVQRMSLVESSVAGAEQKTYSSAALELIEMSPRLEVDMSTYTESFSVNSSIGDQSSFGLPVGSIVSSTGNITLYNEDKQFLFASTLTNLKMLNQDVKFSIYQKVYVEEEGETFNVPIKILYSNSWDVAEDFSVSVSLEDGFKFLRETKAVDLLFSSGIPFSVGILILLDNAGITGFEFKKSSNLPAFDKEDTVIKNFFCSKEQTILEILQEITIATQCSMFYDAVGKLNVLTKERLTENSSIKQSESASPNGRTDFWLVSDESFTNEDEESFYLTGYKANVITFDEKKINPITSGDISYRQFGIAKSPLSTTIQKENADIYEELRLEQFPMNALAFSNYDYSTTILWQPTSDSDSVLAAANLIRDVTNKRLQNIFTDEYSGVDEEDAIRNMYRSISNDVTFTTDEDKKEARESLIIHLDQNEGFVFGQNYEGKVLIDKEYIQYRGILYYVASSSNSSVRGPQIIFNKEQFDQLISLLGKGDSLSFRGLIVSPTLKIDRKENEKYIYKVIGDGRGRFSSGIETHFAFAENSNGIDPDKRFKLTLGEDFNFAEKKTPGRLTSTTQFNFMDAKKYKSYKHALGTLPPESFSTYLGFLKIAGPLSPASDSKVLNSLLSASLNDAAKEDIYQRLNQINKQVDSSVPGDFDDFIFMEGERNIYGQKITLPFVPNSITTRMRLYSPRQKHENFGNIMTTNSSIAGIGFGLNQYNEGYYLEVETAGSGKNFVEKEAYTSNLRFYKVFLNKKGKPVYEPKVLLKEGVAAYTTFDVAVEVKPNEQIPLDPVFELDIDIEVYYNATKYIIKYGDTVIGEYIETEKEDINTMSKNICMFVRNDSQAVFEYIGAAARPQGEVNKKYFSSDRAFNNQLDRGIIPVNKNFLFKNDKIQFYFNDFARLVRQVKEYDIRFQVPAYASALMDISEVNPKYLIKYYDSTAFGAKLTVVNTSFGAVTLGSQSNLPLYIVGLALQEINSGNVSMDQVNELIDDDKLRATKRKRNIAIYGSQSFNLQSNYIQSVYQARELMRWISKNCSRQRMKISMEIYPNPLLELGDKVRLFDKSRGYYIGNEDYGDKTFVISSISHNITNAGPTMNITAMEVGEE